MPDFHISKLYEPVYFDKSRYIHLWGGRGRAGSYNLTQHALFNIVQPKYFRAYFVRKIFNDIRTSLWQDFKDRITESGINTDLFHFNENEMTVTYKPTGNTIKSSGTKAEGGRTAKLKSLAGATHVYIDELDELEQSEFDQLDISIRTKKSNNQILCAFNPPPKKHWVWKDYVLEDSDVKGYLKATPKSDNDLLSIFSTYTDNIKNINDSAVKKYESFLFSDQEYYYTIIKGLIGEGRRGRIYRNFKPISLKEFEQIESKVWYVIDFGVSSDPNALIEVKESGGKLYVNELLYETGLSDSQLSLKFEQLGLDKNTAQIIYDWGNGGETRAMNLFEYGWQMIKAFKGPGSIAVGVNQLQQREIFLTENSSNGWFEYSEYCWALDKYKEPTNTPIDKNNHVLDAIRYYELTKPYLY